MFESCINKQQEIKDIFNSIKTEESRYKKIIDMGRELPALDIQLRVVENCVKGCQSLLYLHCDRKGNHLFFKAHSEALISKGLAALLIYVYQGEEAETILKCPPHFLEELKIISSLSFNRSNGLSNIYLRMKQDAIKSLVKNSL